MDLKDRTERVLCGLFLVTAIACSESHQVPSDAGEELGVADVVVIRHVSGATALEAQTTWADGRSAAMRALCACAPDDFIAEGYVERAEDCVALVAPNRMDPECGAGAPDEATLVRTIETAAANSYRYAACITALGCETLDCLPQWLWADGTVVLPELGTDANDPGVVAYFACFPGTF